MMRAMTLSGALLLAFLVSAAPQRATAQDNPKGDKVHFETVDGVDLVGTFWSSKLGRKAPCALLLHRIGGKSHEDGWDNLAEVLNKNGFAVLQFDFRGHGASVSVDPMEFWKFRENQMHVRGFKVGVGVKQPNSIAQANFMPAYVPYLVNDIAAAKAFLERKNDLNECNASNIIVIGAEDGATLGAMWVTAEAYRFRITNNMGTRANKPESKDISACVWISIKPNSNFRLPQNSLMTWLREGGREKSIPMAFVYGAGDQGADELSVRCLKTINPNYREDQPPDKQDDFKATGRYGVKGANLKGSKLLSGAKDTTEWIAKKYIEDFVREKYCNNEWEKREYEKYPFSWDFRGKSAYAKEPEKKHMNPVPLNLIGVP